MAKSDPILSKNYSGTFAGGQGPIKGQTTSYEAEAKGILTGKYTEQHYSADGGSDPKPSGEDTRFSLNGKSYAGPENWQPTDLGTHNPDDVVHG